MDIYDEFEDYFMRVVQKYSKDGLVLANNMLYLTRGLFRKEVRNGAVYNICSNKSTPYECLHDIIQVFELSTLPPMVHRKLLRIITDIKNSKPDVGK